MVGVVVSFAILLSRGASRGQGLFSSGAPTPTVTATATEMITATATDQPLFADSLDTPNSNWIDWGDFYTCQASFVNNVLEFKVGGAQGPSGQGCVVRGRSFTDMTLQVQMTFKGGVGQVGGGLIYRGNFFFEVYRDGTFAVMDWRSTPRLDLVRNSSAAINTQLGATNTLSVSVHGTLGEYFVNGQRVAQVSDLPIISGAVGVSGAQIGAASNISIEDFQNFIVRE